MPLCTATKYSDPSIFSNHLRVESVFAFGTTCAQSRDMSGVYKYEDLWVWRLSTQLRDEIFTLTETGKVSRDFKFRDQIRDSSSSAPRNISEGFALYNRDSSQSICVLRLDRSLKRRII